MYNAPQRSNQRTPNANLECYVKFSSSFRAFVVVVVVVVVVVRHDAVCIHLICRKNNNK